MESLNIHDLEIVKLKQIVDERGAVFHYLKADAETFKGFAEAYYSKVNSGIIKGWKLHKEVYQHLCVPFGEIKIVIYDNRKTSSSYGKIDVIVLNDEANYFLLSMPPGLWYSFKCESNNFALLANIINQPHRYDESENLPIDTNNIPYRWI